MRLDARRQTPDTYRKSGSMTVDRSHQHPETLSDPRHRDSIGRESSSPRIVSLDEEALVLSTAVSVKSVSRFEHIVQVRKVEIVAAASG